MNAKATKLSPATMRQRFDTLAAAANLVINARDFHADKGAYPPGVLDSHVCFDDWAADTLMAGFVMHGERHTTRSEDPPQYVVGKFVEDDAAVIADAMERIKAKLRKPGAAVTSPAEAHNLAVLQFAQYEHEVFGVMFFDSQHRLIAVEELFRGTLAQTSVYPREVVKAALRLNAGAAILVHNHPSGSPSPSRADEFLTQSLRTSLALVDVRVLDHVIVGGALTYSFAEHGLL